MWVVRCGVWMIEYGNFVDEVVVVLMCEWGVFVVLMLVIYDVLVKYGVEFGMLVDFIVKVVFV